MIKVFVVQRRQIHSHADADADGDHSRTDQRAEAAIFRYSEYSIHCIFSAFLLFFPLHVSILSAVEEQADGTDVKAHCPEDAGGHGAFTGMSAWKKGAQLYTITLTGCNKPVSDKTMLPSFVKNDSLNVFSFF